jgi:putative ABC transport system permease protein
VILVSEPNFLLPFPFPFRSLDQPNLGLIQLRPGTDPDAAAGALRKVLGSDVRVFTRPELTAHETSYWTTRTSVGLLFGSGLLVAFIVGIMVVYQILATQVSRQLPQFATLKAIGYTDRSLSGTVLTMAFVIVIAAFVPALAAAFGMYVVIRNETLLPVTMSAARVGAVFAAAVLMAAFSALMSAGSLRRADPADIF